jgi:hypothetical protein
MSWFGITRGLELGGLGVREWSCVLIWLICWGRLGCGVLGLSLVTWVGLRQRALGLDILVV